MLLGIVSLPTAWIYCSGFPVAIAAIVVGYVALGQINRGEAEGRKMAVAGISCGVAGIILAVIAVVLFFVFQANQFN